MTNGSGCTRADARAVARELSLVDRERMRERMHESCDWLRQVTWHESEPITALVHPLSHENQKFLTFDSNSTSDRDIRCAKNLLSKRDIELFKCDYNLFIW